MAGLRWLTERISKRAAARPLLTVTACGLLSARRRLGRYSKDCVDDIWIELRAAIAHEFFPGLVYGHRRPARACRRIALKASQQGRASLPQQMADLLRQRLVGDGLAWIGASAWVLELSAFGARGFPVVRSYDS
jgi:hypothetical protein